MVLGVPASSRRVEMAFLICAPAGRLEPRVQANLRRYSAANGRLISESQAQPANRLARKPGIELQLREAMASKEERRAQQLTLLLIVTKKGRKPEDAGGPGME
ncbi:hypothetical protein TWF679_010272 [Orbilia oligospora]|uniref:Uncharacterized protein n=1 Tax=Orbilia oligospora TaxID=2813651 RepID=A0A8H8V0P5_ORBOL|nr:hypothetical protein TWF679_010272 [Orbilia oligospora]